MLLVSMAIKKTITQKTAECAAAGKVFDSTTKRCRENRRTSKGPTLAQKQAVCESKGMYWNPQTKRCNVTAPSRAIAFHGHGRTPGGLTRKDLFTDKYGRIRSRAASAAAKKRWAKMDPYTKALFKAQQF